MNKRIEELITHATDKTPKRAYVHETGEIVDLMWQGKIQYESNLNVEKFAELIVKECISLFDGSHEMKTVGLLSHEQVIQQIKEHFGVK